MASVAWGKKVSRAFVDKATAIASDIGRPVDELMSCMAFESGETFSASKCSAGCISAFAP